MQGLIADAALATRRRICHAYDRSELLRSLFSLSYWNRQFSFRRKEVGYEDSNRSDAAGSSNAYRSVADLLCDVSLYPGSAPGLVAHSAQGAGLLALHISRVDIPSPAFFR